MSRTAQQSPELASGSFEMSRLDLSGRAESVAEVQRVIRESEVTSQPPTPDWSDWINHLASRVLEAMAEWIGGSVENVALFARLLAFSLLAVLGVVLVAAMLRMLRRRGSGTAATPGVVHDSGVARNPPAPTAPSAPIEELLEIGDAAAALRSVWWSLAEYLGVASGRDSSWTGRRLLRRSGRWELLPLVRDLEEATYGREVTTVGVVRQLWRRTQAIIGPDPGPRAERGRPE